MSAVELQKAVFNALTADVTVSALTVGIYDNPLQVSNPDDDAAFPFVTLSDGSDTSWDTDTEEGLDATVVVHTWSRARHALEAKALQDAVKAVLHRQVLTITGYTFIGCDEVSRTYPQRDPDGITRHGVQEFRIVYEE